MESWGLSDAPGCNPRSFPGNSNTLQSANFVGRRRLSTNDAKSKAQDRPAVWAQDADSPATVATVATVAGGGWPSRGGCVWTSGKSPPKQKRALL